MLKALFKKQFLELNTFYFQDKKTGELRSKKKIVSTIALYVLLLAFLGVMFFFMCDGLSQLLETENAWLYYTLAGMVTILLGVFGSVFNTYAGLYHAKDNELLLSMPIPPSKILMVRLFGIALMSLMFEAVVFIPALIVRFVAAPITVMGVIFSVLLFVVIMVLIIVFTCFLGWIVALLAARFKNKSFLTVVFSLVFIGLYYYFFSQSYNIMQNLVLHSDAVGESIKTWLYPFYLMGMAGEGDLVSMLLFTLIAAALFALTWIILSKSFVKISTRKEATAKKVYKEKTVKASGMDRAIFRKELKRFTSSANYMLNTALGSVFMVVGAVAIFIYVDEISWFSGFLVGYEDFTAVIVVGLVIMCASMNDITAPSVSLEGKSIWVVQSMPIPTQKVLKAKQKLHCVITMPPAALLTIAAAIVLKLDFLTCLLAVLAVLAYIMFTAAAGLALNLKKPNLTWTNETIPVKQSVAALVMIFGGWAVTAAFGVGGYFLADKLGGMGFLALFLVLEIIATRLIGRWINTKGAKIFEEL